MQTPVVLSLGNNGDLLFSEYKVSDMQDARWVSSGDLLTTQHLPPGTWRYALQTVLSRQISR